jgi:hypothetical protein
VPLWKLTPAAAPDDPRWQDRTIWSEVIVDAPTSAFARLYAAEWALQDMDGQVGNESPSPNSGFEDEKLYWARRVPGEKARELRAGSQDGARILRATNLAERAARFQQVPTTRSPIQQ